MNLLGGNLWRAAAIAALASAAWQTVQIEGLLFVPGLKPQLADARLQLAKERAAHQATKETYTNAQREAGRLEAERLVAAVLKQQEITDHVRTDFAQQLDAARARYAARAGGRVRPDGSGAGPAGAAGGLAVPGAAGAAGRADETAISDGLSLAERWRATEQALQLDALIIWLQRQVEAAPVPPRASAQPLTSKD